MATKDARFLLDANNATQEEALEEKVSSENDEDGRGEASAENGGGDRALKDEQGQPLSKNAMKRLKRKAELLAKRDEFKRRRKEKRHERAARRRAERLTLPDTASATTTPAAAGVAPAEGVAPPVAAAAAAAAPTVTTRRRRRPIIAPVAVVVDLDFEPYMLDKELVSLSAQLARLYGENRRAAVQARLYFASWGGKLKARFDNVMEASHRSWKLSRFLEENFVAAAKVARRDMQEAAERAAKREGKDDGARWTVPALENAAAAEEGTGAEVVAMDVEQTNDVAAPLQEIGHDLKGASIADEPQQKEEVGGTPPPDDPGIDADIIYLTSDSPHIITTLLPNKVYVIGGLVDKNREKGLCYQRAVEAGVATGKLPIGKYLTLSQRHVLTTNQVVEILLKWLDCGDWGKAFAMVIPMRKGWKLKGEGSEEGGAEGGGDEGEGEGEGEGDGGEEEVEAVDAAGGVVDAKDNGPDDGLVEGEANEKDVAANAKPPLTDTSETTTQ